MRIALDVDGTLADTWGAVIERGWMDESPSVSWDEDRALWDEYLHHSQNVWHNHWEDIERNELFTHTATSMLAEFGHDVDVVTARSGVEESMQRWLDKHRVVYNDFLVEQEKHLLDYDAHIDDSQTLAYKAPADRAVFLPRRTYTPRRLLDNPPDNVYPIRHLRHAAFLLTNRPFLDRHT